MADLNTRPATPADAGPIAEIYNQGIADRIATFETEPRTTAQIAEWLTGRNLVMVAETGETGAVAFAASFPYSARPLLRRHRRVLGLCQARLSWARRRPRSPGRVDR